MKKFTKEQIQNAEYKDRIGLCIEDKEVIAHISRSENGYLMTYDQAYEVEPFKCCGFLIERLEYGHGGFWLKSKVNGVWEKIILMRDFLEGTTEAGKIRKAEREAEERRREEEYHKYLMEMVKEGNEVKLVVEYAKALETDNKAACEILNPSH